MSGFGFERPGSQPVDPRQVGFGLMKRAAQQDESPRVPSGREAMLIDRLGHQADFANARQEGSRHPSMVDTDEEARLDLQRSQTLKDIRAERERVGSSLGGARQAPTELDRQAASPLETSVRPDAEIPDADFSSMDAAKALSIQAAADGVAERVRSRMGNFNRAPTTEASVTQLGNLGMSAEELTILRGAGVL